MSGLLMQAGLCCSLVLGADVVELRDGRGEWTGTVQASDNAALRIETTDGNRQQVPWDLVRGIRFESPDSQPDSMPDRLQRADDIWRARSRLQRGDVELAEPIFEQLFEATPNHRDETDLIIAEGLLRCRLSRGVLLEALIPALETARLRRLGVQTDRYDELGVIHDSTTDLCIYLPPAWPHARALPRLIQQLEDWDAGGDEELAHVAAGYRVLAAHPRGTITRDESTEASESEPSPAAEHAGVTLLELALQSRDEDASMRRSARERIKKQLDRRQDWQQPWLRYLMGMSLLQEPGDGLRRQGLVELAWLPAQHGTEHPYLAGTAMAIMARELARQGDPEAAAKLETELRNRYPNHPASRSGMAPVLDGSQEDLTR